jgi:hypothetical protein
MGLRWLEKQRLGATGRDHATVLQEIDKARPPKLALMAPARAIAASTVGIFLCNRSSACRRMISVRIALSLF